LTIKTATNGIDKANPNANDNANAVGQLDDWFGSAWSTKPLIGPWHGALWKAVMLNLMPCVS
jgi:hypothetical protein